MSRKDFQKGMEAGAKPFEEKFERQSSEFRKTADGINERLDGINTMTDALIGELNGIQKKQLYDLNTVIDIGTLGSDEKELLVAILYTLANMTDYVTEGQQAFIRSVKAYLGVKEVQTRIDLSSIENIENINDQKAILQTVLEFLFIENQNHDYMEEYADVIGYFSVNNKGKKQIQSCIDQIFNATGIQGLVEMYGYQPPIVDSTPVSEQFSECIPTGKGIFTRDDAIKLSGVNVTVPEGYQVIDRHAFFENDTIEYVKLPSTLVKIGAAAFSRCSSLRSVDIQQGLETIEYGAFSHCDRLKSLVLPDTLTTIEENAFNGSTRNLVVRCSEDNSYIRHYCRMNRVKTEHIE